MRGNVFEKQNISSPYLEVRASEDNYDEEAAYNREFSDITKNLEEDEVFDPEAERIEQALRPEYTQKPQMEWPPYDPDRAITADIYDQRLAWRLTGSAFLLDRVLEDIPEDDEAMNEWRELKLVIADVRAIDNPFIRIDYLIEAESAVAEFVQPYGATYQDYLGGRAEPN